MEMVFSLFPALVKALYSTVGLFASELVTLNFPSLPDNVYQELTDRLY